MDRKIFLDNVLGLQEASMNQISEIVKKTYCGTFALQYMHISNAEESAWLKERIEGLGKEIWGLGVSQGPEWKTATGDRKVWASALGMPKTQVLTKRPVFF